MADLPPVLNAECLEGVRHGFAGREGGVSTGEVAGLNCGIGSGDDPARVARNRRLATDAVAPGAHLLGLYQTHSADCLTVRAAWDDAQRPHADAVVTDRPGFALGILTADCAPVLLADRAAGVIGAAHAGWKGALAGVTDSTVAAMEKLGARRKEIVAAIGPCIAQTSYEVDSPFRARFVADDSGNAAFFLTGRSDHWQFDLEAYVAMRLRRAGIAAVEKCSRDTYSAPQSYYSFRRATHRGEAAYGRQISLIAFDG